MTPVLNWKEIQDLARLLNDSLAGTYVDRIVVPARGAFPAGFLKNEWSLRFHSRGGDYALIISVRARHPYLYIQEGKGAKAAASGTRSPFDLALSKHLKGARLLAIEAVPKERALLLKFTGAESPLLLMITLIPAIPEALLIAGESVTPGQRVPVVSRSRIAGDGSVVIPDGSRSPDDVQVRTEFVGSLEGWKKAIEKGLDREAFEIRLIAARRELNDRRKLLNKRIHQSEVAAEEASREADWRRYGNNLKAQLHDVPPLVDGVRRLWDYELEREVDVPCDPKLSPIAQVEKFYNLARRRDRRKEEAESRLLGFMEAQERLDALEARAPEPGDWKTLKAWERELGIEPSPSGDAQADKRRRKIARAWMGKTVRSRDGWAILVGRSRAENLELTFKVARGNDVWMHLRGRPGAHVVIPVPQGKSVPLETLLDAAHLTLQYSGGGKWGKTEVDYTFKKYVKRIKDSTEVSYTQNKALIVEPDPERLKKLQSEE